MLTMGICSNRQPTSSEAVGTSFQHLEKSARSMLRQNMAAAVAQPEMHSTPIYAMSHRRWPPATSTWAQDPLEHEPEPKLDVYHYPNLLEGQEAAQWTGSAGGWTRALDEHAVIHSAPASQAYFPFSPAVAGAWAAYLYLRLY